MNVTEYLDICEKYDLIQNLLDQVLYFFEEGFIELAKKEGFETEDLYAEHNKKIYFGNMDTRDHIFIQALLAQDALEQLRIQGADIS